MYLFIAILGYIFLAVVNIFDKFILTKAVPKPIVVVFYSTALILPIFLLIPFGAGFLGNWLSYLVAAIGGVFFALALWAMFISFQKSEVSHAGPLIGASTPFFVLFLSQLFLKEQLTSYQIIGIVVLIIGSLIVSAEKSKQHHGWHSGMLWGILAGLLFAISHVASKYIYDIYGFYSGLVWTRGFMGLFGVILMFFGDVRRVIFKINKSQRKTSPSPLLRKEGTDIVQSSKQFLLVFFSRLLGVVGTLFVQYAIAIGSVTIVNALAGAQFAFLVILVALISKFLPKLFKEDYSKGEMAWEMASVVVIAVGLIFVIR
jgi:uncharacterized membrane protein